MGVGNRGFKSCPEFKNCYTTTRKTKLTNPNEIIDAIVFHGVGLNTSEIQYLKKKRQLLSKVNKGIEPLYILFMLVSLIKSYEAIKSKNFFKEFLQRNLQEISIKIFFEFSKNSPVIYFSNKIPTESKEVEELQTGHLSPYLSALDF